MDPTEIGVKEAERLRNAHRAGLKALLFRVIFGVHDNALLPNGGTT
jgi:hypothetical protein